MVLPPLNHPVQWRIAEWAVRREAATWRPRGGRPPLGAAGRRLCWGGPHVAGDVGWPGCAASAVTCFAACRVVAIYNQSIVISYASGCFSADCALPPAGTVFQLELDVISQGQIAPIGRGAELGGMPSRLEHALPSFQLGFDHFNSACAAATVFDVCLDGTRPAASGSVWSEAELLPFISKDGSLTLRFCINKL